MNITIKPKNKENKFINVFKKLFCDNGCKEWYYFEALNRLPILLFDLKQLKKMQKKVQGLLKIQIKIPEIRQYILVNGINTILNGFTIFLNKAECYESGEIIVKYTNVIKIDLNDAPRCTDVTINEIITRNTDNIIVEFIHHNDVNNFLVIIIFDVTNGFKCDNCCERDRHSEYVAKQAPTAQASAATRVTFSHGFNSNLFEYRLPTPAFIFATLIFKNLNGYCDNKIVGLQLRAVTVKSEEESQSEIVGDYCIIVQCGGSKRDSLFFD